MSLSDDVPPELESPAVLVQSLFDKVEADGMSEEIVYLDSNSLDHRWGADTFHDVDEEFEYKAIWVAKLVRDVLGTPERSAYLRVLDRLSGGLRAAAWWMSGLVAFVSLRKEVNRRSVSGETHRFMVVLGVAEPTPEGKGPPSVPMCVRQGAPLSLM